MKLTIAKTFGLTLFLSFCLHINAQITIPSVPFTGPTGTGSIPAGWTMVDGSPDFESIPTVPVWGGWTPDPGTLTGLPAGVDRICHTHCLDHWAPSTIGGESFGISVSGLTVGEEYSFTTYTGGVHYSGPETPGDVHSAMWAGESIADIEAMGDSPTQLGRDVEAAPNWEAETWTFTATNATMWIVLGCASDAYRTYAHKGVLWAMIDDELEGDSCDDLVTTVSATELCFGEELTLEATSINGGTVSWDMGATDGVPFTPPVGITTYTATSDNPADCVFSVEITVHDLPAVTASADDDEICIGESVTLTGGGATSYVWDGGVTDGVAFAPGATTTYTVTGTDDNGCENTADVTITVNPLPVIDAGADLVICDGDMITLSGAGAGVGGIYAWDGGVTDGVAFTPGGTTTYMVTGTDASGCVNTDDVLVTVNPLPAIDGGIDVAICEGEMVTLSGSGAGAGGTYAWDGGVTDGTAFTPGATTIYTVTGTDASGCINTDDVTVTVNPIPVIDAGADMDICAGDAIVLSGSGAGVGGTYTWDGGVTDGASFTPGATGTYTVTGVTAEGCVNTDDITITVNPLPDVLFEADELVGCAPFPVTFTSLNPGTTFDWQFGDGTIGSGATVSHTYLNAGTFSVTLTVTSAIGCTASETYINYIEVVPEPVAEFVYSPGDIFVNNTTVSFTNSSDFADYYIWDFGDGSSTTGTTNPIHDFPAVGNREYNVQLIAANDLGCADTANQIIFVKDVALFFIPNTFTPDGDNFNEVFKPIFVSGYDPYDYHMMIFNRWGEMVFESYNAAYGWNGTYGDLGLVQDDVYIWRIEFGETASDKRTKINGHVTLIK